MQNPHWLAAGIHKRFLHGIQFTVVFQSFNRDKCAPHQAETEIEYSRTRWCIRCDRRVPAEKERATAAIAFGTNDFRAGEMKIVAQPIGKRFERGSAADKVALAIDEDDKLLVNFRNTIEYIAFDGESKRISDAESEGSDHLSCVPAVRVARPPGARSLPAVLTAGDG